MSLFCFRNRLASSFEFVQRGHQTKLRQEKNKKNEIFFGYSNLHERTARLRLDGWKVLRCMRRARRSFRVHRGTQPMHANPMSATVVAVSSRSFLGRTPLLRPRRRSSDSPCRAPAALVEVAFFSGFFEIFPITTARSHLRSERLFAGVQTHQCATFAVVPLLILARGKRFEMNQLIAQS